MNPLPTDQAPVSAQQAEHLVGRVLVRLVDALAAQRHLLNLGQTCRDPTVLIAQGLRLLIRSHDIEQCSVFIPEEGQLRCSVGTGVSERPGRHLPAAFPMGEGLMGVAALERHVVWVPDTRQDPRFMPAPQRLNSPGPRTLVCVPLLAEQRLLGVLNVSHSDPAAFAAWQAQAFALFGQLLAHLLDYHDLRVNGAPGHHRRSS